MSIGRFAALAAVLFLARPAVAADPALGEFAARFEVSAQANGPYFRVPLSADVYRYSRSADLADLRLFNGAGERLPFALHAAVADEAAERAVALPVFPIEEGVQRAAAAGARMEIRQLGGATTVVIEGGPATASPARIGAYLLDARQVKARAVALDLDAEFDRTRLVPITVQASRDLKRWRTLAAGEPVFHLGQGADENSRRRVALGSGVTLDEEFLRLTWSGADRFELRGVQLKTVPAANPPQPAPVIVPLGAPVALRAREAEWTVDVPLRFAQLQVRVTEADSLAPLTVMARSRAGEPWRTVGRGVVYRITTDGEERINPPLHVAAGSYAGLKLVLDEAAPPFGAAPALALALPPREATFLARGGGPYWLAIGHDKLSSAALPLPSLVPGYRPGAERAFAQAALGPANVDQARLPRPPVLFLGLDGRTVALWAVLGAAVLLLSAFALSLLRRLGHGQSKPPPSNG
jgi:hypothetical protein